MAAAKKKIAIVGMAFRFPGGAVSPESFWEILKKGEDVVGEVTKDRWGTDHYYHPRKSELGKSYTFSAGTLSNIEGFDAGFFGISPREARQMDPQQRLLLELSWEALESGGQAPEALAGSGCAVYVGISSNDYALRRIDDLSSADAYSMTGNTASVAANRISYNFDLRGPSMALDTACSSSLVALHQACKSLWEGEAPMALVGGVNLLLHPFPFIGFSKASMLSPNGRCRVFDAEGDGYVRAEGGAVLFLKPLEQAEADGDPIQAVIVSSGVNCDGRTSGLTVPGRDAQASLLESVYGAAGVKYDNVAYVEAHGTGTAVGDPIETAAIGSVIGRGRVKNNPLPVGSVKSNLGHLEPASGMAGLVKVVLSLQKRALPASLHMESPNPKIDFKGLNLKAITEYTPLAEGSESLLMGVNSFGFGGANAHVLLENAPAVSESVEHQEGVVPPLLLSARSDEALKEMAAAYGRRIQETTGAGYYDLAYTAAFRRQHLSHRLAVIGQSKEEIGERLLGFSEDGQPSGVVAAKGVGHSTRLALVFSGNGSQWLGMGRELLEQEPLFRQTVEEVDALFSARTGFSLLDELLAEPADSKMHLTEVAQPALFALQVGMVRVLRAGGLEPEAVLGHSVGEVAAAWAAGALTLEQAVQVIHERSAAQGLTKGTGRMAAVGLSYEQAVNELEQAGFSGKVEIAAINSPGAVTLSGPFSALSSLGERFEEQGVFYRLLDLDYAFHSRYMDPIEERILESLDELSPSPAKTPFVSTVTGEVLEGEALGAGYWWENIRRPVRMDRAVAALIDEGFQVFMEIGPHPIMRSYVNESLRAKEIDGRFVPTLRRDADGSMPLQEALYTACLLGCTVDLGGRFPTKGNFVTLPSYPWQRERHWYPLTGEGYDLVNRSREHLLLGYRLKESEALWENHLDTDLVSYLTDHVVGDAVVLPAAGYAEMALAASALWFGTPDHEIEDLEIRAPLLLDGDHSRTVRFALSAEDHSFTIKSRVRLSEDPWTLNAVGRLAGAPTRSRPERVDISQALPAGEPLSGEQHYRMAEALGLSYGPAFQGVAEVWPQGLQAFGRMKTPPEIVEELDLHTLHPALLDACFQALVDIFKEDAGTGRGGALIPIRIGKLRFYGPPGCVAFFRAAVTRRGARSVVADFQLLDESGETLAELEGCRFRAVAFSRPGSENPAAYEFKSLLMPRLDSKAPSPLPSPSELVDRIAGNLEERYGELQRTQHFQRVLPLFDVLASAFAYQAVKELSGGAKEFSFDLLVEAAKIESALRPLLGRLLAMLEEDGIVHRNGTLWTLSASSELPSAEDVWLSILGDHPAYLPELVLAGRCGSQLASVLRDESDIANLLEPVGHSGTMGHLYETSPALRGVNLAVQEMLMEVVRGWPADRRLRILEIGGCGGLTGQLLPALPQDRCDYLFTDDDEESIALAEMEFSAYPCFGAALFDPDIDLEEQSHLTPNSFDIVIAANNLHGVDAPVSALSNVRRLLARDGVLAVLERQPDRFTDITFGVDKAWWRPGRDSYHAGSRLLTPAEWKALLQEAGFEEIEPFREDEDSLHVGAFLVLARNPEVACGEAEDETAESASWVLLVDSEGPSAEIGSLLEEQLREQGQRVTLVEAGEAYRMADANRFVIDPAEPEGFGALLDTLRETSAGCDHLVHLMGLASGEVPEESDPLALQERRCLTAVHAIQALQSHTPGSVPRLWLVTSGGAVFSPGESDRSYRHNPSQAPLWGLGRVIMNEHPGLACKLIDVQWEKKALEQAASLLFAELWHPDSEDEILIGGEARRVLRVDNAETERESAGDEAEEVPAVLDFLVPGQLKNLYWKPLAPKKLGEGEIEIRPRAAGLNFRDVMFAMGLLSDEAVENGFAGPTLGMELAGEVTAVGPAVTDFEIGDSVVGFAPSCFSTRVVTQAAAVMPKPELWTFEESATIPTAFFTVYYSLHHLARIQPGEKILIHGAAGGVGIAAIQYARYCGAEIFATAGTDEKRDFLRLMGVDHILDSRSLAFGDEILEITGGEGVDIVLNSLAGEAIQKNLSILKPFGRFLELGKRDFYENSKVGLRPFRNNISYFGIDADQLMNERPELTNRLFREMMTLFEEGVLRPLPYRPFSAARVADAFRYMQQSRQIGKIVVTFDEPLPVAPPEREQAGSLSLREDGAYLVTGGLSGFGLATARWLATKGARTLVLVGRSGAAAPDAADAVAELESKGINVHVKQCDVSDRSQLEQMLVDLEGQGVSLRGVIHAAMVLDDGLLLSLDAERLKNVLAPKIAGAHHLHLLTRDMPLDLFVMYSSVTTLFGNPGQGNYVAANMYLESLAERRRAEGLPALYVSWGAITDVGYLSRNEEVKESLQAKLGGKALTSGKALDTLEKLVLSGRHGAAVIDLDWGTVRRFLPSAESLKYGVLLRHRAESGDDSGHGEDIRAMIADLSEEEISELIRELLTREIAQILRLPAEKLDANRSIQEMGMDSLMGMELMLAVESRFGIRLPMMAISEGPTIARIAERITAQLTGGETTETPSDEASRYREAITSVASKHAEQISSEERDKLAEDILGEDVGSSRLVQ